MQSNQELAAARTKGLSVLTIYVDKTRFILAYKSLLCTRVTGRPMEIERNRLMRRGGQHECGSCSTYRLEAEGCT